MSYSKQRRDAFRSLIDSIRTSKFPETEAEVVKLAWNIQELAFATTDPTDKPKKSRKLRLHRIFYVYVLMDPRFPGPYPYTLPGGKTITFPFLPFYIGKGNDARMYDHTKEARNFPEPVRGERKLNKIRKIHRSRLEVITKRISDFSIESIAFAKEVLLIKSIGRADKKCGPLTNKTDGGEGASGGPSVKGLKRSAESVEKSAQARRGQKRTPEQLANMRKTRSPEAQENIRAAASARELTQEQRFAIGSGTRGKPWSPARKAAHEARKGTPSEKQLAYYASMKVKPLSTKQIAANTARRGGNWSPARRSAHDSKQNSKRK